MSSGAEAHAVTWINAPELLKQGKGNHGNMDCRICCSTHVWGIRRWGLFINRKNTDLMISHKTEYVESYSDKLFLLCYQLL